MMTRGSGILGRWLTPQTTTRYGRTLRCYCGEWLEVSGLDEAAVEAAGERFLARHTHSEVPADAPPLQPDPGLISWSRWR